MNYLNLYTQIDNQLDLDNWMDDLDISLINTKNDTDEY